MGRFFCNSCTIQPKNPRPRPCLDVVVTTRRGRREGGGEGEVITSARHCDMTRQESDTITKMDDKTTSSSSSTITSLPTLVVSTGDHISSCCGGGNLYHPYSTTPTTASPIAAAIGTITGGWLAVADFFDFRKRCSIPSYKIKKQNKYIPVPVQ